MTEREKMVQDMAMEIERAGTASAAYWTEEELHCWCFKDPRGVKSFAESLKAAEVALGVVEFRQKKMFQ